MSAFVTAAYNVRLIREAVLNAEPETASAFMLAEVFAKMQISTEPFQLLMIWCPLLSKNLLIGLSGVFNVISICR